MVDQNTPAPSAPRSSFFCSPIDAAFIFLASILLLIVFLWLAGRQVVGDMPPVVEKVVGNIWSTAIVGGGAAGMLALRKWMYEHEGPNYLIWIPGCTVLWFALLIATIKLLPSPDPGFTTATAHFTLPALSAEKSKVESTDIEFVQRNPYSPDPIVLSPHPEENGGYRRTPLQIPASGAGNFFAELHHVVLNGHGSASSHEWEYQICLEDPGHANPSAPPEVWLTCDANGSCTQAAGHTSTISPCTSDGASLTHPSVVHAGTAADDIREPGWVIPSLDTLKKQLPEHRGGYTDFTVTFQPTSLLSNAQRFYYSVRVNDTPTFVDGLLPQRTTLPLTQGSTNTFSFALENLDFRGQHDGYEQIAVTLFFVDKDNRVVHQLSLTTPYAALHEAPPVAIRDSLASGSWQGTYVNPAVESRYNIDLEGSPRIDLLNRDRQMLDALLPRQGTFTSSSGELTGPIVTVVRPPWHSTSYGLGLGVKLPTGQVQFTFNHQEAAEVCHWAAQNIHASGMNNLQRMLYDSVTKGGPACD